MNMETKQRWNVRYRDATVGDAAPCRVLSENAHLLPGGGAALDLAAGLGANSILLARHGLRVQAWDIAEAAMDKLAAYAKQRDLDVLTQVRDVVTDPPPPASFDVIVVARFLERSLTRSIIAALRPGGLIFYQTFTEERLSEGGPRTRDFLLAPNELVRMYADLRLVVYREEARIGDLSAGFRDEAMLVAQRRH
jgi:tellurite methyltransferase